MKTALILMLMTATAFASINIVSPMDGYAYFMGEKIQVLGSADTAACSGVLELFLDGQKMTEKTFTPEQTIDLSSFNAELTPSAGMHYVDVTNTCLGARSTSFTVKNTLQIIHSTTAKRAMTGDAVNVTAYAFKRTRVDGITKITADGVTSTGSFILTFETPGEKTITFTADDGLGNTGTSTAVIDVLDALNIQASLDKTLVNPGETVTLNAIIKDLLGNKRNSEVSVSFTNYSTTTALNENGTINIPIPSNALGQYKMTITAKNGSNKGTTTVDFAVARVLIIKKIIIEKDYIKVVAEDQTGNAFNTITDVTLNDENGNTLWAKQVETNAVIEENFSSLKEGNYSINAGDASETFSAADINPNRNAMTGLSLFTEQPAIAGLVIVIVSAVAFYVIKKRAKPGL